MEFRLLGWSDDGPRLDLDHERFAYAGHFGTGRTGIAVALSEDADDERAAAESGSEQATAADAIDGGSILAAASFDPDRAVADALRIRYVSVREDRRGEGIGPALLAFVVDRALEREFERVRIGVNNPVAYRACYKGGFDFTGEESGMGELVLAAPAAEERSLPPEESPPSRYRDGLERFADRDLPPAQREVLERHRDGEPPTGAATRD